MKSERKLARNGHPIEQIPAMMHYTCKTIQSYQNSVDFEIAMFSKAKIVTTYDFAFLHLVFHCLLSEI